MADYYNETDGELDTAKWVVISTNSQGYDNTFYSTKEAAEKAAADWSQDDDEDLVVVAKITTRYTGTYPPRVVAKTEVR